MERDGGGGMEGGEGGRRKGEERREGKRRNTRFSVTFVLCILPNDQTRTNMQRPFRRLSIRHPSK